MGSRKVVRYTREWNGEFIIDYCYAFDNIIIVLRFRRTMDLCEPNIDTGRTVVK